MDLLKGVVVVVEMVKVLIGEKEYEGKFVTVENWYTGTARVDDNGVIGKYLFYDKEESKQSFVSVPKEIQFIDNEGMALKIFENDEYIKLLGYDGVSWHCSNYTYKWQKNMYCVLVPIKREDLKVGDWACRKEKFIESPDWTILNDYCLILSKDTYVKTHVYMDKISIDECNLNHCDWFKVVPKSEVE